MPPLQRRLLEVVVGMVDDNGRLHINPDDFADLSPGTPERARLDSAVAALQSLDPAGVGARSLGECLVLQLDRVASESGESPELNAARRIAGSETRLDFFLRRRWGKLPRRLLPEAAAILEKLDPTPGRRFLPAAPPVAPDVVFARRRGLWKAEAGAGLDFSPRTVRRRAGPGEIWMRERASELTAAVATRRKWTLRIAQWAADRQRAFLESGAAAPAALTMREAAAATGATTGMISHIVSDKRCASPRGTFALKFLFPRPAAGGESAAATAERIRRMTADEDPAFPLTDDALRVRLAGEGLVLARRTVAARRRTAGLPSAWRRRTAGGFVFQKRQPRKERANEH